MAVPLLVGGSHFLQPYFQRLFLKYEVFSQIKEISLFFISKLSSLFIANSKISLFLKKNLPLDHQKKFTCICIMTVALDIFASG
jgi:hypothetical protein